MEESARRRAATRACGVRAHSLPPAPGERKRMINFVVIAISTMLLAVLLGWWRCPGLRSRVEAPKYSMLRQERLFDDHLRERRLLPVAATARRRTDHERSTQSEVGVFAHRR